VDFRGRSEGDVTIVAGDAEVEGNIEGTLNLAVGKAVVSGDVGDSLRVVGGNVELTGDVTGDLIVLGGRVTIPSSANISGDLIIAGGNVDLRGEVDGDVNGYVWRLSIAGTIHGSVDVNVNKLDVRSTANIDGDLTYHTYIKPSISDGAEIRGTVSEPPDFPWDSWFDESGVFGPLLRAMWSLLAGAALILIAPRIASAISTNAGRLVPSGVTGLLGVVLIPIVAVILLVTLIGLPIGVLILAGYFVALYLSQIAVGLAIGRFVLPNRWHDGSRGFYLLAMTLGVLIVVALKLVPVPWVAGIVGAIVTIWGFGAVVLLIGRVASTNHLAVEQA
jgi:cytoskeletal protein CcmA (bactofilin family)